MGEIGGDREINKNFHLYCTFLLGEACVWGLLIRFEDVALSSLYRVSHVCRPFLKKIFPEIVFESVRRENELMLRGR